ncbi:MAG: small-conductance mechanosensitive channel [Bradymonadia bacterium]|jgi:small-conductance mechanosensitive channel
MILLAEPLVLNWDSALRVLQAIGVLVVCVIVGRALSTVTRSLLAKRADRQAVMLGGRVISYSFFIVGLLVSLRVLGFDPHVLLGAAGVLTVAIGFASQTSASNLISGLFLLGERPFVIGNVIAIGNTKGEVISVDLMSVKLRTFDNILVRIPNETLLKTEISNLSFFPIRRYDLLLNVPFDADLAEVREALLRVADTNLLALDEPVPLVIVVAFLESAIQVQFSVWAVRDKYLDLRSSIHEQLQSEFYGAGGIGVPYPRRMLLRPAGGPSDQI